MSNNFGNSFFLTQNIFSKTREQFVSSENYFQTRHPDLDDLEVIYNLFV